MVAAYDLVFDLSKIGVKYATKSIKFQKMVDNPKFCFFLFTL